MFGIKKKTEPQSQTQSDNSDYPRNAYPPPILERYAGMAGSFSRQDPLKEAKKRNTKRKAQKKARKIARKKT